LLQIHLRIHNQKRRAGAWRGERFHPDGYNLLPKDRIGHCHCKGTLKRGANYDWLPTIVGPPVESTSKELIY
jgi:hypothetical protein